MSQSELPSMGGGGWGGGDARNWGGAGHNTWGQPGDGAPDMGAWHRAMTQKTTKAAMLGRGRLPPDVGQSIESLSAYSARPSRISLN